MAKTVDSRSGITTVYYYDLIGRLVGYHETSTKDTKDEGQGTVLCLDEGLNR